jgi:hypothetical protein
MGMTNVRMNTRMVAIAVALIALGVGKEALACACSPVIDMVPAPTMAVQVDAALRSADYVFVGTVARCDSGATVFTVESY